MLNNALLQFILKSNYFNIMVEMWFIGKVSSYKHLRGGVVFTSKIPKTGSGKIIRRNLLRKE